MSDIQQLKSFTRVFHKSSEVTVNANTMYILLTGEVGVYKKEMAGNRRQVLSIRSGNYLTKAGQISSQDLLYIALTDVIIFEINKENAFEFLLLQPEYVMTLVKAICKPENMLNNLLKPPTEKAPADTIKANENTKIVPHAENMITNDEAQLFPEGHGDYQLPLADMNKDVLYEKEFECPICRHRFKTLAIKSYKLVPAGTDGDMRVRYKGIEPIYYDISSCPNCLFSAPKLNFPKAKKPKDFLNRKLDSLKPTLNLSSGFELDTYTVFAGYYLSLICAPLCFDNSQIITANLWMKLHRIYSDCSDDKMEKMAAEKALEAYMFSYQNLSIPLDQEPQLWLMIGEINYKLGNYKAARDFFFKVKTNKLSSKVQKDHVDDRINCLRGK